MLKLFHIALLYFSIQKKALVETVSDFNQVRI